MSNIIKRNRFYYSILCFIIFNIITISTTTAQEAVASNGKFATVKGLKIYYEDTGKGMPLILLHGWTQTASAWKSFIPELSKSYRVIAIDLPGHGRSNGMDTTEVYSFKRATGYIFDVLDQLHIDSANVIGISAGAFITLHMATMKPQFTKSIILIGGQTYFSIKERNIITAMAPRMQSPDFLKNMISSHGKEKGSLILRQFLSFRKLYGDPSFTPDVLATITAKTLIIHGDNDPLAPIENAWEMFQNIPKAHLWIVPNGGHVPNLIPANQDDFIRRSLEFLQDDWDRK